MRLALIAPTELMTWQEETTYQLLLPEPALMNPNYEANFHWFQERNDFIILDNGAAEGKAVGVETLLFLAKHFEVNELALPDVLGDAQGTINRMNAFFNYAMSDHREEFAELMSRENFGLGFVAQGKDWQEALVMVNTVMRGPLGPYLKTVYLPRLLLKNGDRYARVALAHDIHSAHPELNLHLFGSAPSWVREVLAVSKEAPMVRGMDTSMPFNFAIADKRLWTHSGATPERVNDYFNYDCSKVDSMIMEQNINCMLEWAGGKDIGVEFVRSQTPFRTL